MIGILLSGELLGPCNEWPLPPQPPPSITKLGILLFTI